MNFYFRQHMIGLRHYKTMELLIHSSYFTFLLLITAIHVLIFHKEYTKQFMWQTIRRGVKRNEQRAQENNGNEEHESQNVEKTFFDSMINGVSTLIDVIGSAFDWMCRFLEIQSFKIVLVLGFVMSISEVCRRENPWINFEMNGLINWN